MKYTLEKIRLHSLDYSLTAAFMELHISTISMLPANTITDSILQQYLKEIGERVKTFNRALYPVRINPYTLPLAEANAERQKAILSMVKRIKLGALSDVEAEVEASRVLQMVVKHFKLTAPLSYDAKSAAIEIVLAALKEDNMPAHVAALALDKYIARLQEANKKYDSLMTARNSELSEKEKFNTPLLRNELFDIYRAFTTYLLAMANAKGSEQYTQVLSMVNTIRNTHASMLNRKEGRRKAKKAKVSKKMVEVKTEEEKGETEVPTSGEQRLN